MFLCYLGPRECSAREKQANDGTCYDHKRGGGRTSQQRVGLRAGVLTFYRRVGRPVTRMLPVHGSLEAIHPCARRTKPPRKCARFASKPVAL